MARFKNSFAKSTNLSALFILTVWLPIGVFAGLWGVPYLKAVYGVSDVNAARMVMIVWIGVAMGGPTLGWLSKKTSRRKTPMIIASSVGLIFSIIILFSNFSQPSILIALFIIGAASSVQVISFALVADNNPSTITGVASGFNNMIAVLGIGLFQFLTGILLKLGMTNTATQSFYSVVDYQHALLVMPISYLMSLFCCVFLIKETYCKKMVL